MHLIRFVRSREVLRILQMSKAYNKTPSEIMRIDDEYTAFCFDEACEEIMYRISKGEKPIFRSKYKSFADFYKQFD